MRNIVLTFPSGDELDVRYFSVLEAMSACFHVDVIARGREDIDLHAVSGHPAALTLHTGAGSRTWGGVCARIAQTQVEPEGLSTYTLRLVPALWLLTQRRNHRVFQHLSAPQMAQKILAEWQIEPILHVDAKAHPRLEYRVQYGESDYDFLRRQLVEAGISFYFVEDDRGETRLVLSDAPQSNKPRTPAIPFLREASGAEKHDHLTGVAFSVDVHPGRSTLRDFDFRRPSYALGGTHALDKSPTLLEEYVYQPGHSHVESAAQDGAPHGDHDGSYRHSDKHSQGHAARRVEALRGAASKVQFNTSAKDLSPGTVFSMSGHPHPHLGGGKNLLVTQSWISGDAGGEVNAGGDAVHAEHPYRPLLTGSPDDPGQRTEQDPFKPVLRSTKPRIQGVQNAIVTGPKGDEIFTDEHGRVRVQFPWDREGQHDEKSSCWVRVSHAAAGAGFGNNSVPRVGQEVLVNYLDGDPDHPVVVGRMFNAAAPTPYALPEHKTRSSWRSQSSPGGAGANEITFDDKAQNELFYVQAQKDFHKIVKQHELEHTMGNRHVSVDGDLVLHAKGRVIIHAGTELIVKGGPHVKINPSETPLPAQKPLALEAHAAKAHHHAHHPHPKGASGNDALKHMSPGSMPQSAQTAAVRKHLAEKYQAMAKKLGAKHNIPPALILGLMSRESGFGTLLDASGRGDHGHGFGILQVDDRSHVAVGGPYSYEHADLAMGIFDAGLHQVAAAHPGWTHDQQLAGAVAAYNAGPGNIATQPTNPSSWAAMDGGTTGNDYSRDTWAQSQWFANNLKW